MLWTASKNATSGACLLLATLTLFAAGTIATTRTLTAAAVTPAIAARTTNNVQFADEITRRLRRIGISFTRTRLPHPYDPAGEIC